MSSSIFKRNNIDFEKHLYQLLHHCYFIVLFVNTRPLLIISNNVRSCLTWEV